VNDPIELKPGDGPLTVYVVAVLFERRVSESGTWGVGYGAEEVLLAHQYTRPGENPLSQADAAQYGIECIRSGWAAVMGDRSDHRHFAVSRANVNATVVRAVSKKAK
jgi:hypothetical protein